MVYDILKSSLINIWPSVVIITVSLIAIRIAHLKNHNEKVVFYKEFWTLIAIIYMLLLYQMVTRVDINKSFSTGYNLVPFAEIFRYEVGSPMFIYNVAGNIALFIPFGFIISVYCKPKKIWTNLIIAIIVSSTIELVQLNIGRSFDIDDIILNTIGCIIGFLLYIGLNAILKHLPSIFKSSWLKNLICIIITIGIFLYVLTIMGVIK